METILTVTDSGAVVFLILRCRAFSTDSISFARSGRKQRAWAGVYCQRAARLSGGDVVQPPRGGVLALGGAARHSRQL